MLVEAVNHCLKNGLNGTTDYRAFASDVGYVGQDRSSNKFQPTLTRFGLFLCCIIIFIIYSRLFKTSTVGIFSAIVSTVFRFGALSLVVYLFLEDQNSSNETLVLMLTPLRVYSQVPVLVYNFTRYIRKKSWHGRD